MACSHVWKAYVLSYHGHVQLLIMHVWVTGPYHELEYCL